MSPRWIYEDSDPLRSLSDGELAEYEPISRQEISDLLRKGEEEGGGIDSPSYDSSNILQGRTEMSEPTATFVGHTSISTNPGNIGYASHSTDLLLAKAGSDLKLMAKQVYAGEKVTLSDSEIDIILFYLRRPLWLIRSPYMF